MTNKIRISILITVILGLTLLCTNTVISSPLSVGYGLEDIVSENNFNLYTVPINFQDDNKTNDDNDDKNDNQDIDLDNINDDEQYPVWNLLGEKYFETPFRRFEVIFFASFSYVLFLNITIIETISTIVPYFGGRIDFSAESNTSVEPFSLPLLFYTFASSVIFAISIAAEDYRYVYIENAPIKEDDNINNDNKDKNNIDLYFAPGIIFGYNKINFRLFMINF
jgi:hypothetical protein